MLIEPGQSAAENIVPIFHFVKCMPLACVDDELCWDAERFECMPEFERLRCRTLTVAFADHDQRGRFDLLDVVIGELLMYTAGSW